MATITFETLTFKKEKQYVTVNLMKLFYFTIPDNELENIGKFKVNDTSISFFNVSEKKANSKLMMLITKHLNELKSNLGNRPTTYIHKNSGIPLIGNAGIGIVDRGSSIIEIKTVTGCNLACIYCSVDEGNISKKKRDFVVEKDYIVDELKKLLDYKDTDGIEININPHGEPTLYGELVSLIEDISTLSQVSRISIDTNGMLLSEPMIKDLKKAGLTQINLSLNSMNKDKAKMIGGNGYDLDRAKNIAKMISQVGIELIIAPVIMAGINDDLDELIVFAQSIGAKFGIQNFLPYKRGRNPVKPTPMETFYLSLEKYEKKHKVKLIVNKDDFHIKKTKQLPKPFDRGDCINAVIVCDGRYPREKIAAAKERSITVNTDKKVNAKIKINITRSKHNIFFGEEI